MISIKRVIIFSIIPAAVVLIIILLTAFSIQGSYTEIYVQPHSKPIQEILANNSTTTHNMLNCCSSHSTGAEIQNSHFHVLPIRW